MRISFNGAADWLLSLIIIAITVRETAMVAMASDSRTARNDLLRKIILVFAAFNVVLLTISTAPTDFPGFSWGHAWDLFA